MPTKQIVMPSQCFLKYVILRKIMDRTTADGIEKSSIIITEVIDVIVYA
jgi:hypothetical protein